MIRIVIQINGCVRVTAGCRIKLWKCHRSCKLFKQNDWRTPVHENPLECRLRFAKVMSLSNHLNAEGII